MSERASLLESEEEEAAVTEESEGGWLEVGVEAESERKLEGIWVNRKREAKRRVQSFSAWHGREPGGDELEIKKVRRRR